ncbi:CoA transferase, partial [Gordonia jinhuaensis]|uniref:CoA transferase n=1 Tax=Gordonia jinhuaensis TaxID=1517702 RepID=UPI0016698CDD
RGTPGDRAWAQLASFQAARQGKPDQMSPTRAPAPCDAYVASRTAQWTTAELDERLAQVGIPAAQINELADVIDHPQLGERDRWRTVGTSAGDVRAVLPPMSFRDVELRMDPVPGLGEHTDSVAAEISTSRVSTGYSGEA